MKIAVTGPTGNVGRPLVPLLSAAGATVVPVSRPAADLTVPSSLAPLLSGADALFLLVPGAGVDAPALMAAVRSAGVGRVVLLSSQAAGTRPDAPSHAPLRALEAALHGSGLRWTVLRPGGFFTNTFAWAGRGAAAPYPDVALPMVDPADIAAVAAAVLLAGDTTHDGATYVLTGPAAITPRERAAALGLDLAEQTPAEARVQMLAFMPPAVVDGTLDILGHPLPAEQAVSPDVERVLGRAPGSFAAWAVRNAASFTR